jgi:hypothetical protein
MAPADVTDGSGRGDHPSAIQTGRTDRDREDQSGSGRGEQVPRLWNECTGFGDTPRQFAAGQDGTVRTLPGRDGFHRESLNRSIHHPDRNVPIG